MKDSFIFCLGLAGVAVVNIDQKAWEAVSVKS